eukprot:2135771-Rhodomonas_salina.5
MDDLFDELVDGEGEEARRLEPVLDPYAHTPHSTHDPNLSLTPASTPPTKKKKKQEKKLVPKRFVSLWYLSLWVTPDRFCVRVRLGAAPAQQSTATLFRCAPTPLLTCAPAALCSSPATLLHAQAAALLPLLATPPVDDQTKGKKLPSGFSAHHPKRCRVSFAQKVRERHATSLTRRPISGSETYLRSCRAPPPLRAQASSPALKHNTYTLASAPSLLATCAAPSRTARTAGEALMSSSLRVGCDGCYGNFN